MESSNDDYSNQGLLIEHFGAAAREDFPYIRLAAAVLRVAGEDLKAAFKAEASIRDLADQKSEEGVVDRLASLLELVKEGHNTILWINGAEAPLKFENVSGQIEIGADMTRWCIARIFQLDIEVDCSAVTSPWADLFEAGEEQ